MTKKKHLLFIFCIAAVLILFSFIMMRVLDIHFNLATYHTFEQDGYSFKFKGSFGEVRKVIVKKNSEKIGSLPHSADASLYENPEFTFSVIIADADADGDDDIFIPCAFDSDLDTHYTLYLAESNGKLVCHEETSNLSNIKLENELIFTEENLKDIVLEEKPNSPEIYIKKHIIAKHTFRDGRFITLEERSVIYYSENDYYCYSVYTYDEATDELKYSTEDWFDADELDKFPLNWD